MVLSFESVDVIARAKVCKSLNVDDIARVLVTPTFESMDGTLKWDHSNESYSTCGAVHFFRVTCIRTVKSQ